VTEFDIFNKKHAAAHSFLCAC